MLDSEKTTTVRENLWAHKAEDEIATHTKEPAIPESVSVQTAARSPFNSCTDTKHAAQGLLRFQSHKRHAMG